MKRKLIIPVCIMILMVLFTCGCVDQQTDQDTSNGDTTNGDTTDDNETTTSGIGTLQLKITDKPGDLNITHANVTISTVQVHRAEAEQEGVEENETDDEDGGETNTTVSFTVDVDGEYEGEVNEEIQFSGSASGGEEPYNWSWDFGDGNTSTQQNPTHQYAQEGTYTVNLTVTDNTSNISWDITTAIIGEEEEEDNTDAGGWFDVVNESQTFDLIALQNVTDVLGENTLTVGKYTQIRLTVESGEITINNNGSIEVHELKIPSGTVKLIQPFWITENETTTLTLDFDVYESVHQTGNNNFIMNPTIKVIEG